MRAYAGSSSDTSPSTCGGSQYTACTWLPPPGVLAYDKDNGWWPLQRPPQYASDPPFEGVDVDFATMQTWFAGDFSETGINYKDWQSAGCSDHQTVCQLQFRLENTATNKVRIHACALYAGDVF